MNEKQDQRPVYMGTFSKYTRAFESRVALMENDVEYHKKTIKRHVEKIEKLERTAKYTAITTAAVALAILMLHFLV